jgi:hypothetical protein
MRCNVDLLKIIQVGITLADEDGNYPQEASTWQFNFRFSVRYVCLNVMLDPLMYATHWCQRRYVRARVDRIVAEVRY